MKFKTAQRGGTTVVELDGNLLGGPDAATLNSKLHQLIESGKKLIVVDMAKVQFMNSSGLGMLIGSLTAVRNAGGNLTIANASEKILTLIKVTRLSSVFETFDSVEAAIARLKE